MHVASCVCSLTVAAQDLNAIEERRKRMDAQLEEIRLKKEQAAAEQKRNQEAAALRLVTCRLSVSTFWRRKFMCAQRVCLTENSVRGLSKSRSTCAGLMGQK